MTEKKYDNSGRGSLWPNRKRTEATHPHFVGEIEIPPNMAPGVYWFDGWKRAEGANPNAPSLKVKIGKMKAQQPEAAPPTKTVAEDMDDEIPF